MRVQPVVAKPDPPADADPVQREGKDHGSPGGIEERDHCKNVKYDERDRRDPADPGAIVDLDVGLHGNSFGLSLPTATTDGL